jgi:hypothetical protein
MGPGKPNLFMPRESGGLGAKPRHGIYGGVTERQLRIEKWNLHCLEHGIPDRRMTMIKDKWMILKQDLANRMTNIVSPMTRDPSEGLIASYSSSRRSRLLARDDWLANISRVKINGRGFFRSKWTNPLGPIDSRINELGKFGKVTSIRLPLQSEQKRRVALEVSRYNDECIRDRKTFPMIWNCVPDIPL